MVAFNTEVGRLSSKLDVVGLKYYLMSAILSILENCASNHVINQQHFASSRHTTTHVSYLGRPIVKIKPRKTENQPFTEFKYHEKTNYMVSNNLHTYHSILQVCNILHSHLMMNTNRQKSGCHHNYLLCPLIFQQNLALVVWVELHQPSNQIPSNFTFN